LSGQRHTHAHRTDCSTWTTKPVGSHFQALFQSGAMTSWLR